VPVGFPDRVRTCSGHGLELIIIALILVELLLALFMNTEQFFRITMKDQLKPAGRVTPDLTAGDLAIICRPTS
jgi:hypothetical protein